MAATSRSEKITILKSVGTIALAVLALINLFLELLMGISVSRFSNLAKKLKWH